MAADNRAKLQNEAEKYMLQGKISQAIGEYLKIVQNNPEDILTLNTIGDLYLTIGKTEEASDCFVKVGEKYVRNNFFLKAIAVYKKILRNDPDNLEINNTIASLYAKQGLNTDACSQYFRLVKLYEQNNKTAQVIEIYEKIADLDPANADIQKKLAEAYLAEEKTEKGREFLLNAARAMAKTGDHSGAKDCFSRALRIDPLDINGLNGFKECCLKTGETRDVIEQLKASLEADAENLDIKEMLGQAYLAAGETESAFEILKDVISEDESRYRCFTPVIDTLIDQEEFEQASEYLDPIIPVLITRRKTDLAVEYYNRILQHKPMHIPTMEKLASVHQSSGDITNHLDVLDKIVEHYVDEENRSAAMEHLETILKTDPESKKHLDLHKVLFVELNPDTPYVPPVTPDETREESIPIQDLEKEENAGGGNQETIVEADLLINYGMKEKALGLLQNLEALDPYDRKVRTRLLTLYKEEDKFTEAAEQCLLLAALHRRSNDEESAEQYLSEAKQFDPDLVDQVHDLDLFARKKGIITDSSKGSGNGLKSDPEVDLSGDLLDIFFTGKQGQMPEALSDIPSGPNEIPEGFGEGISAPPPTQSIEEKIQEVDFYIRLGFSDEALNKLNEISKIDPENPELPSRYEKLKEVEESVDQAAVSEKQASGKNGVQDILEPSDSSKTLEPSETSGTSGEVDENIFQEIDIDAALDNFNGETAETGEQLETGSDFESRESVTEKTVNPKESLDFSSLDLPEDTAGIDAQEGTEETAESESLDFSSLIQEDQDFEIAIPADTNIQDDIDTGNTAVPESPDLSSFDRPDKKSGAGIQGETSGIPGTGPEELPDATEPADFLENDMFSDLLEEVSSLDDQEIEKESFEDHFSLGTAYRDMDLIEEAIKEFQTALRITEHAKDSRKLIQCCGMLSTCFLKKGMPRSALRWCRTGLNVKDITKQELMALRYDMGVSHAMEGNRELALQCFDQIFSIDPGYRDVALKIDDIKGGQV